MKFSVRLDYLFEKESMENQIRMAAECGVEALEMGEMKGYDCRNAARIAEECGTRYLACGFYDMWNCRMGDPYQKIEYNFEKTIECALELKCRYLLSLGINSDDRSEESIKRFVENMMPVAERIKESGLMILIEPHNTKLKNPVFDFSHYLIETIDLGAEVVRRIGSKDIQLLYDVYHEQIMSGNLFDTVEKNYDLIQHYHLSGTPGRDEPENGEVNAVNFVNKLRELGYSGFIGMEYFPSVDACTSLKTTIEKLRG